MVDRRNRASVASFFHEASCAVGDTIDLEGDALAHAIVRRLGTGDAIRLVNGRGTVAGGSVAEARKKRVRVLIDAVESVPPPSPLEVLVPVADRDRMLLAAEKCVEFQITGWRPVCWARSASVAGSGGGERFATRVLSRMRSALEQSGGAWLPEIREMLDAAEALRSAPTAHQRILLDANGPALTSVLRSAAAVIAVGPEGGFEATERDDAVTAGWTLASIGSSVLRFETAIIAGAAVVRAQHSTQKD